MKPRKRDIKTTPVGTTAPAIEVPAFIEGVKDYAIFALDTEGRVMTWNEGARTLKGYTPEEIVGQSFTRFYAPEDRAARRPQKLLAQAAARGWVEDEGWRVRKDGSRFWADVVITAVHDQTGRLTGYAKVTRDLTERHATHEQLRQSEERLRLLIESVKDYAIFMLDTDGRIASWNAGAERINGYRADEVLGQHFSIFYADDDLAQGKPERELQVALAEGRYEDEGWRIRKGGERFWANAVLTSIHDATGTLRGFSKVTRDLTERRRAEELLRQSEHRTRLVLDNVRDYAIFMLDAEGRISSWNPGSERINGYRAVEVLGQPSSIFYTAEDVQAGKPAELLAAASREGRAEVEGWRVRKDGTRFWADVVIARVQDPSGRVLGYAKVTRDLTERRRVEQKLRQSEERLRLMIDSIKDYAIFMLDPRGRVSSWNPGAQRLMGYSAAEITGQHRSRFYPREDTAAGKPNRQIEQAGEHGRFEDEGWRVRKDGSRFWANAMLSAIHDRDQLIGFAEVLRDMTERRRVQEELAARAHQQAAVADLGLYALQSRDPQMVMSRAATVAKATLDVDMVSVLELSPDRGALILRAGEGWRQELLSGELVAVSASAESEAGYTLASPWPVVVEDRSKEQRFAETTFLREHGVVGGVSVVVRSAAGDGQPYGVFGAHVVRPRQFRSDEVHFLQAVANVVATAIARTHGEQQLARAQREADQERDRKVRAEAALHERDEFISVASHELRTPLTALQLKLQSVAHAISRDSQQGVQATSPDDLARWGKRIDGAVRQADRLATLVERLLDVSRVVGGRLDLEREDGDLAALVQEVVQEVAEQAQLAGSPIRLTATPAPGRWDRTRLRQVVTNLLTNAIKYGAGKPIEVTVERIGALAHLTVTDHGIGIAPQDLGRLFGRFERAASVRNYGGMGLGLYISRHIVEAHGGSIDVRSEPGLGSIFSVILPDGVDRAHGSG